MTYEEAIKMLDRIRDESGWTNDAYDSLTLAIEVLESQMPKKPLKDGYINLCPRCESEEIECELYDGGEETRFEFCPHCGQAIDWSDAE